MSKVAAALLFLALPAMAQTKPENNITPRARIYEPKYLNGVRAEQVGRFVQSVVIGVHIGWEPVVKGLVITSMDTNPQASLDQAEALLKRFDVPVPTGPPERQIEMTIYLVRGFGDKGDRKGSVPPELEPVVKEMKGALPYLGFNLVDTIVVNVRDGLKLEDALPSGVTGVSVPYFYSLEFHDPSLTPDGKTVSVGAFRFAVKVPVTSPAGSMYQDVSIATPLTIHEGQKQVLGKIKLHSMSADDLFVVLTYKLK